MENAVYIPPSSQPKFPLPNFRKNRYLGDDCCLAMHEFAQCDRLFIQEAYQFLEQLFVPLKRYQQRAEEDSFEKIQATISAQDVGALLSCVRRLGVASVGDQGSERMSKTVHDLRGGAMTTLIGELQMAQLHPPGELKIRQLFFLARDHLKIMRNALLGLDDAAREADLVPKMHGVDLIVEKWQHVSWGDTGRPTRMHVDCSFHGNIAECCVEFGALDRVLYNLVNNASRHTASGEVTLTIQNESAGTVPPANLLFEVSNPVSPSEQQKLEQRGDLSILFGVGVSSTGSGYGLAVAIDFVTNAYGLGSGASALAGGYLGAELSGQNFNVWFHWPVAADV